MSETAPTKWELLEAPFPFSEIEVKVQSLTRDFTKGLAIAYFDARSVRRRLNSVLGRGGWKSEYRTDPKGVICRLTVIIDGEPYTMEDGADYTDIASYKGGVSDSFKRCFAALCNDTLYSTDLGWQPCETYDGANGKKNFKCWTQEAMKNMESLYVKQTGAKEPKKPPQTEPKGAPERKGKPDKSAPFGYLMEALLPGPWQTKMVTDQKAAYFWELCAQYGIGKDKTAAFRSCICRAYGLPPEIINKAGGYSFGIEFLKDAGDNAILAAVAEMNRLLAEIKPKELVTT